MSKAELPIIIDPKHPNANIHGVVRSDGSATCMTANEGVRCTGCCWALRISEGKFQKAEGDLCPEQRPKLGCAFVLEGREGKPNTCSAYHCSSDRTKIANSKFTESERRLSLLRIMLELSAALNNGEINEEQYKEGIARLNQAAEKGDKRR